MLNQRSRGLRLRSFSLSYSFCFRVCLAGPFIWNCLSQVLDLILLRWIVLLQFVFLLSVLLTSFKFLLESHVAYVRHNPWMFSFGFPNFLIHFFLNVRAEGSWGDASLALWILNSSCKSRILWPNITLASDWSAVVADCICCWAGIAICRCFWKFCWSCETFSLSFALFSWHWFLGLSLNR